MMDQTAFLTVDLRDVAKGKIEDSVLDGLRGLQRSTFDPENIGAEAKRKLVFQNLLQQLHALAENPSEPFTRLLLQNAGLSHVRSKALMEYQDLIKSAFREFINLRILRRLDLPTKEPERSTTVTDTGTLEQVPPGKPDDRVVTTDLEIQVFNYVKQRLAFLIRDESLFGEIGHISFKDYQGKFVVYYKRERKGRLFDFIEGSKEKYWFSFGTDGGEVSTSSLADIDKPLLATFLRRIEEEKRVLVAV